VKFFGTLVHGKSTPMSLRKITFVMGQ